MQPRRLSRAAGMLRRERAWNARSKQGHVPDAKQVLLWKGWVPKQRLNDVQSRVGATATQAHVESPLRTELVVDSCMTSGQLLREHMRNPGHLGLQAHTRMFIRQARTPQAHLDLSPCAKLQVLAKRLLRSHATSTLGSLSVRSCDNTAAFTRGEHTWISLRAQTDVFRRKHCCILHSHAASTLGSLSVCKKTCSGETIAAFSRREHTWISLRAQAARHVHATDCCVLTLRAHLYLSPCANKHVHVTDCCVRTPQAHLDLSPCAKKHVPAKRLLRSHAASTLGSLVHVTVLLHLHAAKR